MTGKYPGGWTGWGRAGGLPATRGPTQIMPKAGMERRERGEKAKKGFIIKRGEKAVEKKKLVPALCPGWWRQPRVLRGSPRAPAAKGWLWGGERGPGHGGTGGRRGAAAAPGLAEPPGTSTCCGPAALGSSGLLRCLSHRPKRPGFLPRQEARVKAAERLHPYVRGSRDCAAPGRCLRSRGWRKELARSPVGPEEGNRGDPAARCRPARPLGAARPPMPPPRPRGADPARMSPGGAGTGSRRCRPAAGDAPEASPGLRGTGEGAELGVGAAERRAVGARRDSLS